MKLGARNPRGRRLDEETPEERSRRLTRERVNRHRAKDKPRSEKVTIILSADDAEAWREILSESGVPDSMFLTGGTYSYIAEEIREYRKEVAEEALKNVQGDWEKREGGVTTGYLQSQQPPESGARLLRGGKPVEPSSAPGPMSEDQEELADELEWQDEIRKYDEDQGRDNPEADCGRKVRRAPDYDKKSK